MISFCTLVRDAPHLNKLIEMFKRNCPTDYEICIADNSQDEIYIEANKALADVYITITDKELWKMGIPWAHNRIAAEANTYKIFYLDSDEYPVWIHPNIEDLYETSYVLGCHRIDFLDMKEIIDIDNITDANATPPPPIKIDHPVEGQSHQDRLYNSRYVQFNGNCHAIFHCPGHFRMTQPAALILHNKTVRDAKDLDRMKTIIREQMARANINNFLASSDMVLQWGKNYGHKFEDFNDFITNYTSYPYDD